MKVYLGSNVVSVRFALPHQVLGMAPRRRVGRMGEAGYEETYTIPHGVRSVHVWPMVAAISFVRFEPRTKSQKNLGNKQPQKPAQTTTAGKRRQRGRGRRESARSTATEDSGERNAQTEAKMLTNRAHWCQINFPMVIY